MRRLLIALSLLVLAGPLLVVGLGVAWANRQQQTARESLEELLTGRLLEARRPISQLLEQYAQQLDPVLSEIGDVSEATYTVEPLVADRFLIDSRGRLLQPANIDPLLAAILKEQPWLIAHSATSEAHAEVGNPDASDLCSSNWTGLFVGPGLQLYRWQRNSTGSVQGVVLRRGRWMADVIAALPDSPIMVATTLSRSATLDNRATSATSESLCVIDAAGREVYRWGTHELDGAETFARLPMPEPLSSWQLTFDADPKLLSQLFGHFVWSGPMFGLIALALVLLGLGAYVLAETTRQYRIARQRVSFVGQVSHEFRTPLTNIRLYAELLEQGDIGPEVRRKAGVIRSEAERLGRLITNVLELSKQEVKHRPLRQGIHSPDDVIDRVLDSFQPTFSAHQVELDRVRNASQLALLDADVLEQILVNLLSNVEKYAISGRYLGVTAEQHGDKLSIAITDHGPGISKKLLPKLFEPFSRGSDAIDAPAGMGIGLAIARSLARSHGGDLLLQPSTSGACFTVELDAPPESQEIDHD